MQQNLPDRKPKDYDWVYIAGGALLGGFTAHVWTRDSVRSSTA